MRGSLALSILQDSRILCRNIILKQCNLLQIEIPIPVVMFNFAILSLFKQYTLGAVCHMNCGHARQPLLYCTYHGTYSKWVALNTSVKPSMPLLSYMYVVQICDALI